ncbi:hypothetical protein [Lentzea cavernae]|uniref:HTH cro/C1-type domain-containing protein n=1 Tax=Lentzea cavernae TaxID=2020703 RepID=A0ABQ3MQD6_9PSEU|nr:hypothetical protein [Lentzea cavernae]GHH57590.1 hypothetical protein GCM10017774_77360 [Lentzea cavernae]
MSAHVVSWAKLIESLETACRDQGKSMREVAKELGIAGSGLTRLRQGKSLSADATAALVAWLYPDDIPPWIEPCSPTAGRSSHTLQRGEGDGR